MTGQADALPAARRRKRKNIKAQGPDTPPTRPRASATARADIGPRFRAGWRIAACPCDWFNRVRYTASSSCFAGRDAR